MSRIGFMNTSGPFGAPASQQVGQAQLPMLSKEEEDSLLSRIGGKVMGGLGMVGDFLDKYTGGRAARGLLGGKPEELLSLLPFSDALGITDEKNKVTGRDLTDNIGLTDRGGDSWLDSGLAIGADILTNPTSYLTFGGGALTEAGQAAARAGIRGSTMRDRIRGLASLSPEQTAAAQAVGVAPAEITGKALGGVVGVGLPFSKPSFTLGGEGFLDAANAVGSTVANVPGIRQVVDTGAKVLDPVVRHYNALFTKEVGGATSARGQVAGRQYTGGTEKSLAALRGKEAQIIRGLQEGDALDLGPQLRQIAEGQASGIGPKGEALNSAARTMKELTAPLDAEGAAIGFVPHKLVSEADGLAEEYAARQLGQLPKDTRGYGGGRKQALPLRDEALGAREDILRNVPGATEQINRLSVDPEFSGLKGRFGPDGTRQAGAANVPYAQPPTQLERVDRLSREYLGLSDEDDLQAAVIRGMQREGTPLDYEAKNFLDAYEAKKAQAKGLEDWAASLDPKRAELGIPAFSNHPLEDAMSIAAKKAQRNEAGKAVHSLFADTLKPSAESGPGWVPVRKALEQVGFDDPDTALNYLMQQVQARTGVGTAAGGVFDPAARLDWYVPPEAVRDAARFQNGLRVPEALQGPVGVLDWITNLTKTGQTALWPGFHTRNAVSGVAMNAGIGAAPEFGAAQALLRGQTVEGASEIPYIKQLGLSRGSPLTDEEATREIANLAYQYRATSGGVHGASEATGAAQAERMRQKLPGLDPFEGFGATLKEAVPTSLEGANPLNVRGVSANEDLFAPVAAGRKIGGAIEETNRVGGFVSLLKQGYHPEEAARLVRQAHIDYGNLSDFEKEVMRRVVPFYSFTKGNLSNVAQSLAERPSGFFGSVAQGANELRQGDNSFLPDYLGGGLALPLGAEDATGNRRFLTKIDTPVEAAFDKLRPTLGGSAMAALGELNPVLKMPLEYATGKQFMSGRDLADLYPISGNTLLDQTIMNSPLSRAYTTYRTLTDPRKDLGTAALNLGTGVKVSDVDLEKARDLMARDFLSEQLRGQHGVGRSESYYLRPGALEELTPEQIALLRLEKSLDARSKKGKVGVPVR